MSGLRLRVEQEYDIGFRSLVEANYTPWWVVLCSVLYLVAYSYNMFFVPGPTPDILGYLGTSYFIVFCTRAFIIGFKWEQTGLRLVIESEGGYLDFL